MAHFTTATLREAGTRPLLSADDPMVRLHASLGILSIIGTREKTWAEMVAAYRTGVRTPSWHWFESSEFSEHYEYACSALGADKVDEHVRAVNNHVEPDEG